MTDERHWGAEPWRAPPMIDTDILLFGECGRVLGNTCYRSHYFRLVEGIHGGYFLLVKHGGGVERHHIGYSKRIVEALVPLDSDSRYFMLHTLYTMAKNARYAAELQTAAHYQTAFVQGRLKKRALPKQGKVKVWIENEPHPFIKVSA